MSGPFVNSWRLHEARLRAIRATTTRTLAQPFRRGLGFFMQESFII
jgi:hypothetical protein